MERFMPIGLYPLAVTAAAQRSQRVHGCPASVACSQWALESAYGAHMSGKNNPFGIKAKAGEASTAVNTHEVINGQRIAIVARFRDFASLEEAFDAHGKLLATAGAYAEARAVRMNAKAYAQALTGHYATDPNYGAKLIAIMDRDGLYALDTFGTAPIAPTASMAPVSRSAATTAPGMVKPPSWSFLAALRRLFTGKAA